MTFEHKLLATLEEIRAVVFECSECKSRIAVPVEKLSGLPLECPRGHRWDLDVAGEREALGQSPFLSFVMALKILRQTHRKTRFTIYLEFDEPRSSTSS